LKENKIALVTEAGNGLGIQFALIIKNRGLDVILAAKGDSYRQLKKTLSEEIKLLETDFTTAESIQYLKEYIDKAYGKLDILVNNAETANGFGQKIDQLIIDDIKQLYEENFFSVISVTQIMYPLLLKSSNAQIINITSALGKVDKMKDNDFCYSDYKMTGYATAKAALEMLTILLCKEFKAININIASFDPVRLKNSTHNDLILCKTVEQDFLELLKSYID